MSTSKLGLKEYIEMCAGKWNAIIVEEVGWGSLGGESSMIEFLVAFLNCLLLTKDKDKPYVNMGKTFVFIITSSVVDTIESHFRNWANCPPTGLPLDEGHDPLSPPDLDSWGFLENPENGRKEESQSDKALYRLLNAQGHFWVFYPVNHSTVVYVALM
ncbi:hypothetical protein MCOR03_006120 [Pyricularia oryzae]|nr:hypothetical protein MCOR24_000058 [Pyricularia oryzae]KAI6480146.1 hypothetical protein MCOR18_005309 [Pyricularia oryzae]KAI6556831.1 hypothetical protein MCOR03_006120 [Pyricularia oryzae]